MKHQIDELTAVYTQPGDALEALDEQYIELRAVDAGAGMYYVLETKRWAFESLEEITALLQDFLARAGERK